MINLDELMLTEEEIRGVCEKECIGNVVQTSNCSLGGGLPSLLKAQLAKAEPLIRKDERAKMVELIEEMNTSLESADWITIIKSSPAWQALKEEKLNEANRTLHRLS